MGREIKFRAWDKGTGKMLLDPPTNSYGHINYLFKNDNQQDCIWMQFTGLHDRNGKEIWEGDVVTKIDGQIGWCGPAAYGQGEMVLVEWQDEIAGFYPFANYDCDCGVENPARDFEVIGNIHEHPELLEDK